MRKFSILIFIIILSCKASACECPEYSLKELDKQSYEWSDVVLIGNISSIGNKYQVEIEEILKGKITNRIIEGLTIGENEVFSNCTFYPRKEGKYLLYFKMIVNNGKIYYFASECLGSRLLNFEHSPVSLYTEKSKAELIEETKKWINELRFMKYIDLATFLNLRNTKFYK